MIKNLLILGIMLVSSTAFANHSTCHETKPACDTTTCECPTKIKWKTKTIIKEKLVKEELDRNALSLIAGANPTGLYLETVNGQQRVKTGYEFDFGVMYQRDFDDWRGSVALTIQGNMFLGAGARF